MQKWYEQRFVNRRDWILDHLGLLGLSPEEAKAKQKDVMRVVRALFDDED